MSINYDLTFDWIHINAHGLQRLTSFYHDIKEKFPRENIWPVYDGVKHIYESI